MLTISAKENFLSGLAASEATTVSKMYCTPASCKQYPDSARAKQLCSVSLSSLCIFESLRHTT